MAAGREIGGFPKKLGHIEIQESPMYYASLESPKGLRICSGEMNAFAKVADQRPAPAGDADDGPAVHVAARACRIQT
jgi:hypothetical protein